MAHLTTIGRHTSWTAPAESASALRVLHVIDNLALGGTQHLLLKTVRSLEERGIPSRICVLGDVGRNYAWEGLPDDVVYLSLRCDYRRPWEVWRCARQVRRTIEQVGPSLVHSYLWLSDVVTALANRGSRRPHVSHIVDRREWQESRLWKHRVRRRMTQWAFRGSRLQFLAVSAAARQYALDTLKLPPQSVRVAFNGVDPASFDDIAESDFARGASREMTLGTASRLEPEKGHLYLFDALAEMNRRGRRVRLLVTGKGPYQGQLVERCRQLDIASQVEFVGWIGSMGDLFSQVDVFVVPSIHSEGLPTTILEAMAAGRAVVATDIGGAAEAIRSETDGLIVPPRDPQKLADALLRLQDDHTFVATLARAARERVADSFSVEGMVNVIESLYREVCPPPKSDSLRA